MSQKNISKYFSEKEMQRCTPSCSLQDLDPEALAKFDKARELAGIPFVINSAYRPKAWELSHGRNGNSAHVEGTAFDIRCHTPANRWKIIDALLKVGCTRIGISTTFIHADFSKTHTNQVVWTY